MPDRPSDNDPSEDGRAITRFRLLRPFFEDGVPLASVARAAKMPLSTAADGYVATVRKVSTGWQDDRGPTKARAASCLRRCRS